MSEITSNLLCNAPKKVVTNCGEKAAVIAGLTFDAEVVAGKTTSRDSGRGHDGKQLQVCDTSLLSFLHKGDCKN